MYIEKERLIEILETKLEKELANEMSGYRVIQFPANTALGKEGDELRFISIVLEGSIRAIREDKNGDEILIYNIEPMQSCIITITSAIRNHASLIRGITNELTTAIAFPKEKGKEWMRKYDSWRDFTIELYEKRLNELLANHQIVKQQKENILESIHYAKRIQTAALPPENVIQSLFPEHFILFKPRNIVSGDYYWMTQIERKTIVVVADCTGHGVPGAFMSMLGISILNQYINNNSILPANEILEHLRENVKKSLRQVSFDSETKDGMDMALMIFDFETNKMEFAGANNPLYIVRNEEMIKLEADKMPVGVHLVDDRKFNMHEFNMQKGDCFYAFSDGYVDQVGGENNRKFMRKNFTELLLNISNDSMPKQKEILSETIEKWQGTNEQVDDILVMGIRI